MIHLGIDSDPLLGYNEIVLNITAINEYDAHYLIHGDTDDTARLLASSRQQGMYFEYVVQCDKYLLCRYMTDTVEYNRTVLEHFVVTQLDSYFDEMDIVSSLQFTVISMTEESVTEMHYSGHSYSLQIIIVAAVLVLFLGCMVGMICAVLKYHRINSKTRIQLESKTNSTDVVRRYSRNIQHEVVESDEIFDVVYPCPGRATVHLSMSVRRQYGREGIASFCDSKMKSAGSNSFVVGSEEETAGPLTTQRSAPTN